MSIEQKLDLQATKTTLWAMGFELCFPIRSVPQDLSEQIRKNRPRPSYIFPREKIEEIRNDYKQDILSLREIRDKYGISKPTLRFYTSGYKGRCPYDFDTIRRNRKKGQKKVIMKHKIKTYAEYVEEAKARKRA